MKGIRSPRGQKKRLAERARVILNSAPPGGFLSAEDEEFLVELLHRHPEAALKIGAGIDHFEVAPDGWGGRCFWVVRIDGTRTDFSYRSCINPPSPMQDFAAACRRAVVDQVIAAKEAAFGSADSIPCAVTGVPVTRQTSHIDHAPPLPFEAIVAAFAVGRDLASEVEPTRDGETSTRFNDEATARSFAAFHRERAVLRVVSKKANLGLLRRKGASS